jgi:hypothetical protein
MLCVFSTSSIEDRASARVFDNAAYHNAFSVPMLYFYTPFAGNLLYYISIAFDVNKMS